MSDEEPEKTEPKGKPPEEGEPPKGKPESEDTGEEQAGEGGQSEEPGKSQVDIAKELVDEMKKQNKVMSENLKKAEKLTAEQLLGGNIPAGSEIKEMTEEEKEIAAAKKLLEGTGFAEQLFPDKKE